MLYNSLPIHQKINAKGNQRNWDGLNHEDFGRHLIRRMRNRNADFFNPTVAEYNIRFNYKEPANPGRY